MAKVLVFCDYFLPGYKAGGPVVSLSGIVAAESRHEIRVVTRDRDLGDEKAFPSVAHRTWTGVREALVAYMQPGSTDWPWLRRELRSWSPDLVYINSLQSPSYSLLPLSMRASRLLPSAPLLIAPRGECAPGARRIRSMKKSLARGPIKRLLGASVAWHASSEREVQDIANWWGRPLPPSHRVLVRTNPAPHPAAHPSSGAAQSAGPPVFVFASRIDPMKGLSTAIESLRKVSRPCTFRIHGVVTSESYWQECQALLESLPAHVSVEVRGGFRPEEFASIVGGSDLFVLPTHGENFGHAIAQSLSQGCPVAVSTHTIWSTVARAGGGFAGDSAEELAYFLDTFSARTPEQRHAGRQAALDSYRLWHQETTDSSSLFSQALTSLGKGCR